MYQMLSALHLPFSSGKVSEPVVEYVETSEWGEQSSFSVIFQKLFVIVAPYLYAE